MSNRKIIFGIILVLIGFALLAQSLDIFDFSFRDVLGFAFPLLLIGAGLWVLAHRRGQKQADEAGFSQATTQDFSSHQPPTPPEVRIRVETKPGPKPVPPPGGDDGPRVSHAPQQGTPGRARYSKFMGDMLIDCKGVDLQNVEISNFLGDVEVKLHGGKLAPGLNRMIISGFIGDIRVLVPEGMAVFAQASNFIGDIEMMGRRSSGFGNSLDAQSAKYSEASSKLYIASNHFIGDVRVYVV